MFCEGEVASATLKCLWLDPGMVGKGSALSNKSLPLCNIIQSEIDWNWDLLVNNSLIWQSDFYRLYRLLNGISWNEQSQDHLDSKGHQGVLGPTSKGKCSSLLLSWWHSAELVPIYSYLRSIGGPFRCLWMEALPFSGSTAPPSTAPIWCHVQAWWE